MKFLALSLAVALPAAAGSAKAIASYDIKARYDATSKVITGSEVLTWLNDSPDTVGTLRFHLYMNAFKNQKSTFMRESGGQLRGDHADGKEWGSVDVRKMQIGATEVTKAIRFIHPDDDNADDQTVIEVAPPKPVRPGESIQVAIDFVTKLPHVFARTGYHGNFVLAGQWFPKIGVWETAGFRYSTKGAWNCHQFHAHSEFFANFGRYHVELTLPSGYEVGATGEMKAKTDNAAAKTTTYIFEQEDVTDFAWTAQPNYVRVERMFEADRQTTPAEIAGVAKLHNIPESEARLTDVKMVLLCQPEHAPSIERYMKALEAGIKYFGLWYGHYPYKTLTLVDPPHGGMGAAGMEYPTFITGGVGFENSEGSHSPEGVTVHEFGHQFWMELVATNEFEESWLDEGFNTYSTTRIVDSVFGRTTPSVLLFGFNIAPALSIPHYSEHVIDRIGYLFDPVSDSIVRNAWQYYDGTSYGVNSYPKTGVALTMLERMVGEDTMARIMRTYHQRYRFHHPNSRQFQQVAEEVSQRKLDNLFDQFIYGNRLLDYSVGSVESQKLGAEAGMFDQGNGFVTITIKDANKKEEEREKDKKYKPLYESTVKVRRLGDGVMPVVVKVKFDDGSEETRTWDGEYRWEKFVFRKPAKVKSVAIDPEHKYTLDVNWYNNAWRAEVNSVLVPNWSTRVMFIIQNVLLALSGVV